MRFSASFTTQLFSLLLVTELQYGEPVNFGCINAVQHRASRFFIGVGKYTPNAAVNGDIGWTPPLVKQWKTVISHWIRLDNMDTI